MQSHQGFSYEERELISAAKQGNTAKVAELINQGVNVNVVDEDGNTPLIHAVNFNHGETVKLLCENSADVNHKNKKGRCALINAISFVRDKSIVDYLIEKGASFSGKIFELAWRGDQAGLKQFHSLLKTKDSMGNLVLHYAAAAGNLELVQWLITEIGMEASEKDEEGRTALHYAAWNGHLNVVQWLKNGGARVSEKSDRGFTALHYSVLNRHVETAQWLLEKGGASLSEKDDNGRTALHLTVVYDDNPEMIRYLLKINKTVASEKSKSGQTPLIAAASHGCHETVRLLLEEAGANIAERDIYEATALLHAAKNGHLKTVECLLTKGANVDECDDDGATALHHAAMNGHLETVEYLLTKGANIDECDDDGNTVLHRAVFFGNLELVKLIMKKRPALVSVENNVHGTPLYDAAEMGHTEIVMYLLEEGGTNILNKMAASLKALHIAAFSGHLETVQRLLETGGVNIADRNAFGNTLLYFATSAALDDSPETLQWLLKNESVNLFAKDQDGATALTYAIKYINANPPVAGLLLDSGAGIKQDFTGLDLTNVDMKNRILIGATSDGEPVRVKDSIQSNEALRNAIDQGVPFNCAALQKAVAARLAEDPNDSVLQETRRILNAMYNVELKKTIANGETLDWVGLRKKVIANLTQYPDEEELIETKRRVESSSLRNLCIFSLAYNLNKYPDYRKTLTADLILEVEKLAEDNSVMALPKLQ